MPKPKFDPNQPFQAAPKPKFDPTKDFTPGESAPKEPAILAERGAGQAALESFGNAATLGYLPQIQAGLEKPMAKVMDAITGNKVAEDLPGYTVRRDEHLARQKELGEQFPKASTAGTIGGIAATAISPAGLGKLAVTTGLRAPVVAAAKTLDGGQKLARSIGTGAMLGAAANPGDTAGEVGLQADDRIKNMILGGILGGAADTFAAGMGELSKKGGEYFKKLASTKAFQALGGNKKQHEQLIKKGLDEKLGQEALESKIVSWFNSPKAQASLAEAQADKTGQKLADLLARAQKEIGEQEAAGAAPFGGWRRGSQDIEFAPLKETVVKYGKPETQTFGITPPRAIPSGTFANQGKFSNFRSMGAELKQRHARKAAAELESASKGFNPYGELPEVQVSTVDKSLKFGKPEVIAKTLEAKSGYRIDAANIADEIGSSPELAKMRKTPGLKSAANAVDDYLETLAKNGEDMTLADAWELRQGVDSSINFSKSVPEMKAAQQFLYKIRDSLRDKMDEAISRSKVADRGDLIATGRKHSLSETMKDLTADKVSRESSNRAIGLTDTIAGVGGLAGGLASDGDLSTSGGLGLAMLALNKASRKYGKGFQAKSAQAIAERLLKVPQVAQVAETNPTGFQAMIQSIMNEMERIEPRIPARAISEEEDSAVKRKLKKLSP